MTLQYIKQRAAEIMKDPQLISLISMVIGTNNIEAMDLIRHSPGVVEMHLISYLQEEIA